MRPQRRLSQDTKFTRPDPVVILHVRDEALLPVHSGPTQSLCEPPNTTTWENNLLLYTALLYRTSVHAQGIFDWMVVGIHMYTQVSESETGEAI